MKYLLMTVAVLTFSYGDCYADCRNITVTEDGYVKTVLICD